MRGKVTDLTGMSFGRLTVLKRAENDKHGTARWLCGCSCGGQKVVRTDKLRTGQTTSCGCLQAETRKRTAKQMAQGNITHGLSNSRIYDTYQNMIKRCYDPSCERYKNYGARGIYVCDEWLQDKNTFFEWARNSGYQDSLTIDRIDVDGPYAPTNCRWADKKAQANNRSTNHILEYRGEKHTIAEWADIIGINASTIYARVYNGKSVEESLKK